MKKKSLLLILLMALIAPWAANAQTRGTNTLLSENFDDMSSIETSYSATDWFAYKASGDNNWSLNTSSTYAHSGSKSARYNYTDDTDANCYLVSAPFNATMATLYVSLFERVHSKNYPEEFEVFLVKASDVAAAEDVVSATQYAAIASASYTNTTYSEITGSVTDNGLAGQSLRIVVHCTSESGMWNLYIDDIVVTEPITDPYIDLDPTSATVFTGFTETLTASYGNVTGTPTITYSSDDESVATVTGSGTSATVTAVAPGTATITATMTYNATDYTATCDVTVEDPSYCTPSFSYTSDYIESFTTTGGEQNIDNQNSGQGTGGYSNFYDTHFVSAEPETEIGFSVVRGYDDSYYYAIWVDWNKDYEFDNTTEKVAYTSSSTGDWSGSFTIPAATAAGDYHMRVLQIYTSNVTPCASASYGEGEDYKLTVIAANPYQKPVNLHLTNLEATTATLAWEAPNSDVQSYKYQYREEGGTWNALTSTTALSAPLADLTGNTTYEFQVQAIYAGNNESNFVSKTFTTECNPYSINPTAYQYGFETADDMDCWELVNGVTNTAVWDNATIEYNFGYEPARTGDYCFMFYYVNYDDTDPEYQTLISPQLTDLPANGVHVEFYYVGDLDGSGQETFRVGYSTTDKNLSSFTWGTEITDASTAYQRFSANYPQGTKYVAVQHTSDDQYYLFLDDFTFEGAADCLEPSDVLADNITTTSADITWTAGGEETAWDIYVTDDSTIVPDDGTTPTYANVSTKPYPLSLTPATTYYVYVRAACKGTETSAWSTPCVFHTECEGMDLPYGPYGFEDGALSVCWNVINTNTSYNSVTVSDSDPNTGTHSLAFFRGSKDGDLVAVLPEVGAYDLSDYQFEFSAKGSYAGYEITIGIMTDAEDLTTFVAQGDVITTTTSYAEHKVRFNEYTGTGKYVAIKVVRPSSVTYGNIYVDDIAINPIPSCIEPTGLAVTAPTPHGATFSWTAGGSETEWHLYFGKDNTAPADDIDLGKVTVADSNPFTMTTGLDPETDYYVWVRANCGSTDGYSEWVGPKTFTTGVACPAPTGLTASEVTNHTAKLSWTGTSESYVLSVGTYDYTATPVTGTILEEGFESASMPEGWTHIGNGSASPSTSYTHASSSRSLCFSSATSNNVVVLPQFAAEANQLTIDFWSRAESSTLSNSGYFDLGYVTNASDASTFVALETYSAEDHGSAYVHIENYSLSSVPNGARIAFRHRSGVTYYYWYIDDVTITGPTYPIAWNTYNTTDTQKPVEGLLAETPYFAKVKGNCGSEGYSQETAVISFTTDIPCPAPTGLTASNPTSTSFDLQWTNGGSEDWIVAYKKTTDADFTEKAVNISQVTEEAGTISYTLGGLDAETDYIVKVRDNCEASYAGDGVSEWTAEVPYSTIAACSAMNPVVSNVTHHNATVNFEGESATGFTVNYRVASGDNALFEEGFENGLGSWTFTSMNAVNGIGGSGSYPAGIQSAAAHSDSYGFRLSSYSTKTSGETYDQYLVSPELTVTGTLKFYAKKYSNDYADNLYVGYSTTTSDLDAFTWDVEALDLTASWNEFTHALPTDVKYFAFHYFGDCEYYVYVDDIAITVPTPAGAWQTQATTTTTADLTGLTAGTKYDLKVVPNCDETLESATVQFTTLVGNMKYFLTAGEWGIAANWMDEEIPTINDNATIRANVTIAKNYVAYAKNITRENSATITIKDGGELYHSNAVYSATMEKEITGATTWGLNQGASDGWYVISNPLSTSFTPTNTTYVTNLAPAAVASVPQFDLYKYSESNMNWYSYNAHQSSYYLTRGMGFLYSRNEDATISFMSGTSYSLPVADVTPTITYTDANGDMAGWNLLGNPFSHSITWANIEATNVNTDGYFKLGFDGAWTANPSTTAEIKPMEGFLVKATAASPTLTIKNVAASSKGRANNDFLAFTVANSNYSDITYAMFSDGEGLEKINHRNTNVPMVYIPQDGERYAIATMGDETDMFNLNFKAMTTGKYTLSYKAEGSYDYLHVIDRITGEDVDMLIDGEYSFMASAGDNENRFIVKLRYNANGNFENDIFAYQNGDEIIVNGKGELQIFDVMGRFVTSMEVNGSERISAEQYSNAVYIFRLVGNDVKTQKIVVR